MENNQKSSKNKVLASLTPEDFKRLQPHLERVDLPNRKILEVRHRRIESVYFLESGLASLIVSGGSQHSIEAGLIGREGMTAPSLVMNVDRSPHEIFIQMAGQGWRLPAARLQEAMEMSSTLRNQLLLHLYILQVQMSFTALANGRYRLQERLARWIVMAQDRCDGDKIALTHEFLALMLGVRRPGVTAALNLFEEERLVRVHRGGLTVLDRKKLEEAANGCYGMPEAEYARLFGGGAVLTKVLSASRQSSRWQITRKMVQ